jgi:WhiB family redox-sensing transcriptional regulator
MTKRKISQSVPLSTRSPRIDDAPCQSTDPEVFFPDATDTISIQIAKNFCAECPTNTKAKCLTFALENNITYGVWGGLTEDERYRMRRQQQRKELRG